MATNSGPVMKKLSQFVLLEKVGSGGMGTVYKATHPKYANPVALKVAHSRVARDPVLSARFHNEFVVATQYRHPRIVQALEQGSENDLPYLVLEFVPGRSLAQRLTDEGPMPIPEALVVFAQITEAIGFIHENHIVHRDIKPANILLDPSAGAKLADLGLVKDLDSSLALTMSRLGLGTMEFAAPEQFDDAKHVDQRCDIYGLAATTYFALAGRPAFGPVGITTMVRRKLDHQFTALAELVPAVSPALDQTITRSLHPNPAMRPNSAADFLAGLQGKALYSTSLYPAPLPTATASERRVRTRYSINAPTSCEALIGSSEKPSPARILDISTGGVCLEVPRRFEVGTHLQISLPEQESGMDITQIITVRWIRALGKEKWMLGCAFMRPLEQDLLEGLLGNDLSKTKVIKAPPSS